MNSANDDKFSLTMKKLWRWAFLRQQYRLSKGAPESIPDVTVKVKDNIVTVQPLQVRHYLVCINNL